MNRLSCSRQTNEDTQLKRVKSFIRITSDKQENDVTQVLLTVCP